MKFRWHVFETPMITLAKRNYLGLLGDIFREPCPASMRKMEKNKTSIRSDE
jgi:hypothetical protein